MSSVACILVRSSLSSVRFQHRPSSCLSSKLAVDVGIPRTCHVTRFQEPCYGGSSSVTRLRFLSSEKEKKIRCPSTQTNYDSLSPQEQAAWEALNITKDSWSNSALSSKLQKFGKLTNAQQAAVLHGFGVSAHVWDAFIAEQGDKVSSVVDRNKNQSSASVKSKNVNGVVENDRGPKNNELKTVESRQSTGGNPLVRGVWNLTKKYGPVVGRILKDDLKHQQKGIHPKRSGGLAHLAQHVVAHALDNLPAVIDFQEGVVPVESLETVVYLDDSGSMSGKNLEAGHRLLERMSHLLTDSPTRILVFGSEARVVAPRDANVSPDKNSSPSSTSNAVSLDVAARKKAEKDESLATLTNMQWSAESGGTYMWKMILDDIVGKYKPGGGKLRVILITDGMDNSYSALLQFQHRVVCRCLSIKKQLSMFVNQEAFFLDSFIKHSNVYTNQYAQE